MNIDYSKVELQHKVTTSMEERLSMLEDEVTRLRGMVVSVSFEEGWPQFRQGEPTHEVELLVTAKYCTALIDRIIEYKTKTAWHDTIVESLRETIESLQLDANAREEQ